MPVSAPVCHIPPVVEHTQPEPKSLPSIPVAQPNLQSLAHTINVIRQVIHMTTGRQGTQGPQGAPGASAKKAPPARWQESGRTSTTVRVFQNNDKTSSNWVDIEQINTLTMGDKVTGESWQWKRDK